ncbi:MAG: hypothetical protein ACUVXJ_11790 [Phycisphaerae bacterium]
MNSDRVLEQLAELARQEPGPSVEVASVVMRRIETAGQPTNGPLAMMTGLSAATASVVLYFAVDAWSRWQDPIANLLCSADTVLR